MPATLWKLKTRTLDLTSTVALMGIVNVTPDSFSDGGQFIEAGAATDHAMRLIRDGAAIVDVGGESTRPYSTPVALQEELDRVVPVIESITARTDTPVSVDTSKSVVADAAIAAGAEIINDVTGFQSDPKMIGIAVASGAGLCAMHMQGNPQTMQDAPTYDDVTEEILDFLNQRKRWLINQGVDAQRICLDPGIGFGKTHDHNVQLIHQCDRFHQTGCPILIGHSRKGFIGKLLGDTDADRDAGTLGVSVLLATKGIQIIRVHEVKRTAQAIACVTQRSLE
jgi:dihydropteroate synthase